MKLKINKKFIISFLEMNLGLFLAAITTALFLRPNNIVTGGASGLGILIENLFNIDTTIIIFGVNIILLIFGFVFMGKEFFLKTFYGSLMFPVYVGLISYLLSLTEMKEIDLFLVIIFGAILTGVGTGLTIRNKGTTGGTDIIQAIFFKYFNIPYSKTMYMVDGTIILIGMIFVSFPGGLAAIVYLVITGQVVDNIVFGGFNKRAVYVISEKSEEIRNYIINKLVRGTTNILTEGGYDHQKRNMIVVVLDSNEYFDLRAYIEKIDKLAFIYVTKATEVRGLGFSLEAPARLEKKKENQKHNRKVD